MSRDKIANLRDVYPCKTSYFYMRVNTFFMENNLGFDYAGEKKYESASAHSAPTAPTHHVKLSNLLLCIERTKQGAQTSSFIVM